MKVSAVEDFGLRCLVQIGRRGESGSLTISELSQLEGISVANVGKIMRILRRADFVRSTRGQAGGYALARPSDQISIPDALSALGGRLFEPNFCDKHSGSDRLCTHTVDCSVRTVWRMVQGAVDDVLGGLSLKDLLCPEQQVRTWPASAAMSLPSVSRTL